LYFLYEEEGLSRENLREIRPIRGNQRLFYSVRLPVLTKDKSFYFALLCGKKTGKNKGGYLKSGAHSNFYENIIFRF